MDGLKTYLFSTVPKIAARTAQAFNPSVKITPVHANIKEEQFDVTWYRQFDIVLNALDNLGELLVPYMDG